MSNIFKQTLLVLFLGIFFLLAAPLNAQAVIQWDWVFTNNNQTVSSGDNVTLAGRLTNNSTAGETIGNFASGATAFLSNVFNTDVAGYSFDFGPVINATSADFFAQFGTPVNPGNFIDFTFGIYSPLGVPANGTYTALSESITLSLAADQSFIGSISNCYSWNVSDTGAPGPDGCSPGNGGVIPEPASMLLFASGLAAATTLKRRKNG